MEYLRANEISHIEAYTIRFHMLSRKQSVSDFQSEKYSQEFPFSKLSQIRIIITFWKIQSMHNIKKISIFFIIFIDIV